MRISEIFSRALSILKGYIIEKVVYTIIFLFRFSYSLFCEKF